MNKSQIQSLPVGLIFSLSLLAAISPLATVMYLPALPQIAADLHTSAFEAQLTVSTFLAGIAFGQVFLGPISDRFGRRIPLLISSIVCVIASLACVFASSITELIAIRGIQGFSGAAGLVIGRAVVVDSLEGALAAKAFSWMMTLGAAAPVVAPLMGASILGIWGWRAIYGALTFVAVAMVVFAVIYVKETLPKALRVKSDLTSGFSFIARKLTDRKFRGFVMALVLSYSGLTCYVTSAPIVLQVHYEFSVDQFSLVFATNAIGLVLASFINGKLLLRAGPKRLLAFGLLVQVSAAFLLLFNQICGVENVQVVLVAFWLLVSGIGFTVGNATALALGQLGSNYGSGSALLGAGQFAVAALISPLVGLGGGNSATPASIVLVIVTFLAILAFFDAVRKSN